MSQEQLHHAVAARLRTIATLIGERQSEPLNIAGEQVVLGLDLLNAAAQLNERADRLDRGEFRLTVVGAVSRGKSTLLNACLGKEILPAGEEAVTGGICQVVYGGGNFDEVTLIEKGAQRTMPYAAFCDWISLAADKQPPIGAPDPFPVPKRLEALDYAELQTDAPLCEKGIRFVDTLGFNAGPKQEVITNRFLGATDALLVVLRTAPLADYIDVALINEHYYSGGAGLGNMFFAVNDFGNMSDERRRVLMEETAPQRLRDFFLNAAGEFDQTLFDRRVFLVNAQAALDAKGAGAGVDVLEETGISALERAFERMLNEGEHHRIAVDAAVARTLLPALDEAKRSIQRRTQLISEDRARLDDVVHARTQVDALTQKVEDVQATLERSGQEIARKAAAYFDTLSNHFITPPKTHSSENPEPPWYEDWDSLAFGEILSPKNIAHAAVSKRKRDALAKEMETRLEEYLKSRTQTWSAELFEYLQPDINAMIAATEEEVTDFVIQLEAVQQSVAGAGQEMSDELDMDKRRGLKVAQMLAGAMRLDPSQVIDPMLLDAHRKAVIMRLILQVTVVSMAGLLGWLFMGPLALPVLLVASLGQLILRRNRKRSIRLRQVRDKIGVQFTEAFAVKGSEIKAEIQTNLERQFTELTAQLQSALNNELAAAKSELSTASEKMRKGPAAVAAEQASLETLGRLLTAQFEALSKETYGRILTPEEQAELVKRSTFTEDEDDDA